MNPIGFNNLWEDRFAYKREAKEGYNLVRRVEDRLEVWGDFATRKTVQPAVIKAWDILCNAIDATEEAYS